jgi:phosphatidylserine decarboxylase
VRIAPEGWIVIVPFVLFVALLAGGAFWLLGLFSLPLLVAAGLLMFWALWFFRDPVRTTPQTLGMIFSPADGKVIKVDFAPLPPEVAAEYRRHAGLATNGAEGEQPVVLPRIVIFLNLLNVHVNRVPTSGKVLSLLYRPGMFLNAGVDKASTDNERSSAIMRDSSNRLIVFIQISGLIARRIVNHLREGQSVVAGERFGLIRFGSRAEVFLPEGSEMLVRVGDHVVAGQSQMARLPATPAGVSVVSPARQSVSAGASA